MKRYLVGCFCALFSVSVVATDAKSVCNELQPVVNQLKTQLPQDVDYMTKLTGVQVLYISGTCMLNYNYIVSTQHLLKEMADENQQSDEENLAYLQTDMGEETIKAVFGEMAGNAATTHFAVFSAIPGVKITYSHGFDNTKLKPVVSVVLDTTH